MKKQTDIRVVAVDLYYLPVHTRVPLKFGTETTDHVTCARVRVRVESASGQTAEGWGETPLSVQWVWPSPIPYAERYAVLESFCNRVAHMWTAFPEQAHPVLLGLAFQHGPLTDLYRHYHARHSMPWLAALVCSSAFDIAVHDAFGNLVGKPVYATYNATFMNADLDAVLESVGFQKSPFEGTYPEDFFVSKPAKRLPAWHLVGGKDPIDPSELDGTEPDDGYPVLLRDWIRRDGLTCLKIKLRGNDFEWDFARLRRVGEIASETGVLWLSADFNCTVTDPAYVCDMLDRLLTDHPRTYGMLLYVEQPFPYDLEQYHVDVRSVSARKPLFMDESAHDWKLIRLGRELGWSGVALKTCKTQTGALLSLCWAKAHGMTLMVQDLTNPMLAQIPHALLAAHAGTIMGVETNAMQFYPDASAPETRIHPGLYIRRNGEIDLASISGSGFGYRLSEIDRTLPEPAVSA